MYFVQVELRSPPTFGLKRERDQDVNTSQIYKKHVSNDDDDDDDADDFDDDVVDDSDDEDDDDDDDDDDVADNGTDANKDKRKQNGKLTLTLHCSKFILSRFIINKEHKSWWHPT